MFPIFMFMFPIYVLPFYSNRLCSKNELEGSKVQKKSLGCSVDHDDELSYLVKVVTQQLYKTLIARAPQKIDPKSKIK